MNKDTISFVKTLCVVIPLSIIFTYLLSRCSENHQKEHDKNVKYQIEVVDKYDCIGSSWYLVGGRSSEQEYHVIYKVTPLTPQANEEYYGDGEEDDEVPYTLYRKINVGQKFNGTDYNIKRYNF
jgi:hypothetical protein